MALEISIKKYAGSRNRKLKIHSKFNSLALSSSFKLLKTTREMQHESEIQKHCVASYIPSVNSGECVIYTTIFEECRYTIEIEKKYSKFRLAQAKGYANCEAPEALINLIQFELDKINTLKKAV